jgi:beta-glucanase (GH16 family)
MKSGYVEVALRVPDNPTTWPSVFLVPDQQGQLPMLTVMEVYDERSRYSYGFRYTNDKGSFEEASGVASNRPTHDRIHRYGLDWGYDQITWYYDDQWINTMTKSNELQEVDQMCLVLALGVGGKSNSSMIDRRAYPAIMTIQSINVWQPNYDGLYKFKNVQTGYLMEIEAASWYAGASILQWPDNAGTWQVNE